VLWPEHCIQGTEGAMLHKGLDIPHAELILHKGYRREVDSYSAFLEADKKTQTGLGGYLKSSLFPPGVPKALYILVTPIELISTFLVRPFSLAVRLFANMLAGHLILVTFVALTAGLWALSVTVILAPFSFALLVAMTGFEILVSFLQAFIFTILTAVYIDSSMHPAH